MRPRYNPGLLTDAQLRDSFVVRRGELEELTSLVRGGVQHALVLGWRGMGKTTLLHRLALRVRDEEPELAETWLPVLFDEEQYNIGDLADFWLNALRMVGVASSQPRWRRQAEDLLDELDGERLEEAARRALHDASVALHRRLLLLVDNLDEVIHRIGDEAQQARLREVLQHEPWILLIGASSRAIEATYEYDQPLYQQLRVIELRPLGDDDMIRVLRHLALADDRPDLVKRLEQDTRRVLKLRQLFGGNPRSIALLYDVWKEGTPRASRTQLEAVLDDHTSLYKDRVERLAPQQQRVLDALAQRWEASTAQEVARELRLDRGPVSAQLNRLCDRGLIEKVDVGERAVGYRIRERFFNLWFLMRGSRRSRRRLRWLAEWVDLFYASEDLAAVARSTSEALREGSGEALQGLIEWAMVVADAAPGPDAAELLGQTLRSARQHGVPVEVGVARVMELVADPAVPMDSTGEVAQFAAEGLPAEEARALRLLVQMREVIEEPSIAGLEAILPLVRAEVVAHDLSGEAVATLGALLGRQRLEAGDRAGALAALQQALPFTDASTPTAWPLLGALAIDLGRADLLRDVQAPPPMDDADALTLTAALVEAGHPDAARHAARLRPSEPVPEGAVAWLRAASATPGAAAFARGHAVPLDWMRVLGLTHRLRPAEEVHALAMDGLETEPDSLVFAVWASLTAIATGRPVGTPSDRLDAPLRSTLSLVDAIVRRDAPSLAALTVEDVSVLFGEVGAIPIDASIGPVVDQLWHALLRGIDGPVDSDQVRATGWPALVALAQVRVGDPYGALETWAGDPHPEHTPSTAALALTELASATRDQASLLLIAGHAHTLRRLAPGPWQVHVAVCAVEAGLGRAEPALDALRWALGHLPGRLMPAVGQRLVDLCLDVARLDVHSTLDVLASSRHAERMVPLLDALRIEGGDDSERKRLPPERLDLAEDVLERLRR